LSRFNFIRSRYITLVLLLSLVACGDDTPVPPVSPGVKQVQSAITSGLPTIVEFGAEMCDSCIEMKKILGKVAVSTQGRAHVLTIDITKDWKAAQAYRIQVMPTQVFFSTDGREIGRHMGKLTEAEVLAGLGLGGAAK